MAIWQRIKFFRNRKGMAQYESEARIPKPELDIHQIWSKVPSQVISGMLLAGLFKT